MLTHFRCSLPVQTLKPCVKGPVPWPEDEISCASWSKPTVFMWTGLAVIYELWSVVFGMFVVCWVSRVCCWWCFSCWCVSQVSCVCCVFESCISCVSCVSHVSCVSLKCLFEFTGRVGCSMKLQLWNIIGCFVQLGETLETVPQNGLSLLTRKVYKKLNPKCIKPWRNCTRSIKLMHGQPYIPGICISVLLCAAAFATVATVVCVSTVHWSLQQANAQVSEDF